MRQIIALTALGVTLALPAAAETTKGGYPACVSEDLFGQITTALVKKDEPGFDYLMKNGCMILKGGLKMSVLDRTWTGTAKIRVYVGDDAVVLWTNSENIAP